MANEINLEKAKEVLDSGLEEAKELIQDPSKITDLLAQVEEKIKEVPVIGTGLANVPTMISLVKSYITKEYDAVSPKVIVSGVSALLYLVKKKDLIPGNIPILGQADDIAVIGVAMKVIEPELNAYKEWKESQA